jgi:hypothetical protein
MAKQSMAETRETAKNHYQLLGIKPNASMQQIRRAYRDLSKLYHPDTTELPDAIATRKFQALNDAYATLSNPEQRTLYDHKIGYSRLHVMQAPPDPDQTDPRMQPFRSRHLYLDPTDRPLSAGEIFALFILGVTFAACLALVVIVGFTKGEISITPFATPTTTPAEIEISHSESYPYAPALPEAPAIAPGP